jgi:hypothetical protein
VKRAGFAEFTTTELLRELRHRRLPHSRTRGRAASPASPTAGGALAKAATPSIVSAVLGRQRVIYGTDDRKDLYQVTDADVLALAKSVAALVKSADLGRNADGSYTLATTAYGDEYDLCGSEPFVSQPLGCFCTGFLVAPDVIATAGHCAKSAKGLASFRFVFGFRMKSSSSAVTRFPKDDVYKGIALIGREQVDDGPDWALVRLDRPAAGRQPLAFRRTGKVADAASLFVIGHPNGLPAKFADGAAMRGNAKPAFFTANLDTYGGNSGSPVFHAKTREVEGILVRGENDFVSNGTCNVSLVCPNTGCRGEDVTRSTVWGTKVPKS